MADRTVKVSLTAQVQGYIDGMQQAAQATRETGSAAEKLSQQQATFEEMGRAAMVAGGAVVAGLGLSAKAAMDWESAWAGVTKTVEGSPEQLQAVEDGLRGLAQVLPASHTEIAAVAEAAGQLGIQTPNVVAFTRTMIDLGETTNLSADQAATSLAQMMNIMGTSQSEVDRMGATLVALGNAGASTESEILMMAQRIAGAGKLVGATEGEVLGLSNALASMGVTAELGGGVASRILQDLYNAAQEGGEALEGFANVAGMTSKQFADAFKNDPVRALDSFAKGLNGVEASGGNVVKTLTDLGFKSTEEQRVLLQLKGAGDLLTDSLDLQAKAWEENTALSEEAAKRYETTESAIAIMRNKVVDAAIAIGEQLLPALEGLANGVGGFADMIGGLEGPGAAFVAWTGVAAGGVLLLGGVALAAIPKVAAFKVALDTLGISTSALGRGARGVAGFMLGPWGAALAAAGISVQVFNAALDGSKASSAEFLTGIKQGADALDIMAGKAQQNESGVTGALVNVRQHFENLPALADKAAVSGRGFWSAMSFNENAALDAIKELGTGLQTLAATDLPRAQDAFAKFVGDAGLNDTQALTLMNEEMTGFKNTLIDAAEKAGVATDDATLLQFALGKVGGAAKEGAEGTAAQNDALGSLEENAEKAQEAIKNLADEISGFAGAQLNSREANRQLEESLASLGETLGENGKNFDITTAAGRENEAALDAVASAANNAAADLLLAGGSQEQVNAKLAEGREKLTDILAPYFESRDAAAAYVAELNLISPERVTEIVANTDQAAAALQYLNDFEVPDKLLQVDSDTAAALEGIEGVNVKKIDDKTSVVYGNNADAQAKIQEVINNNPAAKVVPLTGESSAFWNAWAVIRDTPLTKVISIATSGVQGALDALKGVSINANGGIHEYANGGIAEFAGGGFATGIYSGGAPIHKFAEPETGWEAYISGKPDQRDRNRQIWVETGERLGLSVGEREIVHVPTHVTVVDADNRLTGTMRVIASKEVSDYSDGRARARRRTGLSG